MSGKKVKSIKMPSAYVIIYAVIVAVGIWTHFVGGDVVPATLADILLAPITSFKEGISISLFILLIGGFLKVIEKSGALEQGIAKVVSKTKGREILLIPILMFLISLGGSTYGMSEETLALYPIVVATLLACGYDVITGTATILCGVLSGVSGATINPFSIGTAVDALQNGPGIEVNQGLVILLGAAIWLSSYAISCVFVMRYAKQVQKHPERTVMTREETEEGVAALAREDLDLSNLVLSGRIKATLVVFGFSFLVMIVSLIPWADYGIHIFEGWSEFLFGVSLGNWYFNELSAWFLIMAVVVGIINKMPQKELVNTIIKGASEVVGVAMIVGLSKGVSVVMSSTGLDLYLLDAGTRALANVPGFLYSTIAYSFYSGFNILIPSTSGLATATIPTMGALSHSLGFSPEVMISTYVGAHFIVGVIPTSGTVMSSLSICKIEYTTWLKLYGKIFLVITVVNLVLLALATNLL